MLQIELTDIQRNLLL